MKLELLKGLADALLKHLANSYKQNLETGQYNRIRFQVETRPPFDGVDVRAFYDLKNPDPVGFIACSITDLLNPPDFVYRARERLIELGVDPADVSIVIKLQESK